MHPGGERFQSQRAILQSNSQGVLYDASVDRSNASKHNDVDPHWPSHLFIHQEVWAERLLVPQSLRSVTTVGGALV